MDKPKYLKTKKRPELDDPIGNPLLDKNMKPCSHGNPGKYEQCGGKVVTAKNGYVSRAARIRRLEAAGIYLELHGLQAQDDRQFDFVKEGQADGYVPPTRTAKDLSELQEAVTEQLRSAARVTRRKAAKKQKEKESLTPEKSPSEGEQEPSEGPVDEK